MIDTGCTVHSYQALLDMYDITCSKPPKWLLEKLGRRVRVEDVDKLHRLALEAGVPKRYAWAMPDETRNEMLAAGTGLYLHGVSGDGKSTRAASYLKGWIAAGMGSALWVQAADLMTEIGDTYKGRGFEGEVLGRYTSCALLVIDDLGKERRGDWSLSKLFQVISGRYDAKLPTVITSQHSPTELADAMQDAGDPKTAQAIISRLRETYKQQHCGDEDRRMRG